MVRENIEVIGTVSFCPQWIWQISCWYINYICLFSRVVLYCYSNIHNPMFVFVLSVSFVFKMSERRREKVFRFSCSPVCIINVWNSFARIFLLSLPICYRQVAFRHLLFIGPYLATDRHLWYSHADWMVLFCSCSLRFVVGLKQFVSWLFWHKARTIRYTQVKC